MVIEMRSFNRGHASSADELKPGCNSSNCKHLQGETAAVLREAIASVSGPVENM